MSNTSAKNQRYLIIWRWHFYAGVLVTPFLILLAATGLAMLLSANIQGKEKERLAVAVGQSVQPLSRQAQAALEAADKERGSVVQYIAPRADDQVAVFRVNDGEGGATMVAVDPYTAAVVDSHPRNQNFYQLMDDIHGDLLIGTAGDFMMEAAASLTILLILTGLYLWWNKQRGIGKMLAEQAIEVCRRAGCDVLTLEVRARNTAALAWKAAGSSRPCCELWWQGASIASATRPARSAASARSLP